MIVKHKLLFFAPHRIKMKHFIITTSGRQIRYSAVAYVLCLIVVIKRYLQWLQY